MSMAEESLLGFLSFTTKRETKNILKDISYLTNDFEHFRNVLEMDLPALS